MKRERWVGTEQPRRSAPWVRMGVACHTNTISATQKYELESARPRTRVVRSQQLIYRVELPELTLHHTMTGSQGTSSCSRAKRGKETLRIICSEERGLPGRVGRKRSRRNTANDGELEGGRGFPACDDVNAPTLVVTTGYALQYKCVQSLTLVQFKVSGQHLVCNSKTPLYYESTSVTVPRLPRGKRGIPDPHTRACRPEVPRQGLCLSDLEVSGGKAHVSSQNSTLSAAVKGSGLDEIPARQRGAAMAANGETVPRHLLDSANRTISKLQKQLDEIALESRRETEEATGALQNQLRVVQNQQRMAEDQLHRSMQRERDLRNQASNADVTGIIGKLRGDLAATTQENEQLRQELERANERRREHEELQRRVDAMQLDMDTHEATHVNELRKAHAEIDKLRKALENADVQLVDTVEAKDRELQQIIKDKESMMRTQQEELQELHDALTESHNILAATDQVSNQYSERIRALEQELQHVRTQHQESVKHAQDLERQCRALEEQIGDMEADLAAEQDLSSRLTQSVSSYETQ
eukprot:808280-Rhodomonas_salina.1